LNWQTAAEMVKSIFSGGLFLSVFNIGVIISSDRKEHTDEQSEVYKLSVCGQFGGFRILPNKPFCKFEREPKFQKCVWDSTIHCLPILLKAEIALRANCESSFFNLLPFQF